MMQDRKDLYSEGVQRICKNVDVDPKIMMAIIEVESAWNPYAVRYEAAFNYSSKPEYWANMNGITEATERQLQRFSFGLGQIMGGTARSLVMKGPLQSLCEAECGAFWSAVYFKKICERYVSETDRIAAYNSGSAQKRVDGTYMNQEYVDKVEKIRHM